MDGTFKMSKLISHSYIFLTILFTVYSQLIMRWQVSLAGQLPYDTLGKIRFIVELLLNPWVLSGIISTFFAGVSWMLAMTRFEISYAFPFVSLNYILILIASVFLFNELFTITKFVGSLLVIIGIIVIARG
jgi:drug/metabolite transporter (DMT)-like permease